MYFQVHYVQYVMFCIVYVYLYFFIESEYCTIVQMDV